MIKKLKKEPRSEKGCRAIERERIWESHGDGYEEFYLRGCNCSMLVSSLCPLTFKGIHGVIYQKIELFYLNVTLKLT
jgi:hypothetical protein